VTTRLEKKVGASFFIRKFHLRSWLEKLMQLRNCETLVSRCCSGAIFKLPSRQGAKHVAKSTPAALPAAIVEQDNQRISAFPTISNRW
jgi:hypothetical protein